VKSLALLTLSGAREEDIHREWYSVRYQSPPTTSKAVGSHGRREIQPVLRAFGRNNCEHQRTSAKEKH